MIAVRRRSPRTALTVMAIYACSFALAPFRTCFGDAHEHSAGGSITCVAHHQQTSPVEHAPASHASVSAHADAGQLHAHHASHAPAPEAISIANVSPASPTTRVTCDCSAETPTLTVAAATLPLHADTPHPPRDIRRAGAPADDVGFATFLDHLTPPPRV